MAEHAALYVAGTYAEPAADQPTRPVISPVTDDHLADLPVATGGQIDRAVAAARAAFEDYRHWSAHERAALCHRIAELIDAHADELARLTTLEQGKTLADALDDVRDSASIFRDSAEDAKRLYGELIPSEERGKRMFTFRVPVGVWAGITPWNFPLMIMCEFLGPALATGNAIVCKPPENTPLVCLRLGALLSEAGVPAGLVSILPGGGPVGEALVTHTGIDAIGFVGSSATAERIVRSAGLKRTLIEASGNGPVVVCADADLAAAADAAVYGATWNSGQVCCATERVLVDRAVHEDFLAEVARAATEVVLGDPFDAATTMGPLNNEPTAAKMDRHIEQALDAGATLVSGRGPAERLPHEPLLRPRRARRRDPCHGGRPRGVVRAHPAGHFGPGRRRAASDRQRGPAGVAGRRVHPRSAQGFPLRGGPAGRLRGGQRLDGLLRVGPAVRRRGRIAHRLGTGGRAGPTARHDRPSGRDLQPGLNAPHEVPISHDVGVAHPDQSA
jgi:succinate-semialdehyde dehydrogenase/glutarate-semialdehyde dehydrogenase